MAFHKLYCSSCGLEVYPDEELIPYKNNDVYHGKPYKCYPYLDEEEEGDDDQPVCP